MKYIDHSWIKPNTIQDREYQTTILNTVVNKNTLVVLPTGTGKTNISVLLAANRLEKYPDSKILIISPTRPLCAQHQKSFEDYFKIIGDITLVTGIIKPEDRKKIYEDSIIVIATPQTIENDLRSGVIDLKDFSMLTVDEAHKAVGSYAYTYVAKTYMKQSQFPRILALTASPGSTNEKINKIRDNLFIDAVEIRVETDLDVKPYIKKKETEYIKVELPKELKAAQKLLKFTIEDSMNKLRKHGIIVKSKGDLLDAQKRISKKIHPGCNPVYYSLVAAIAAVVKVWHLLELMETQSISASKKYISKLKLKGNASDKRVMGDLRVLDAIKILESYNKEHPKTEKIKEIISNELERNPNAKLIVFSHYRDNIENLQRELKKVCKPVKLIGQGGEGGLKQKEQISVIAEYEAGTYNCLITSPIGEEGLHIESSDIAIFYDSVPSEIRTIQRKGRVGRTKIGKLIFILTKDTRDEIYYHVAKSKESKMNEILKGMQNKSSLNDFL
ncbi:MAG: DEAD/DEAH box helicase [Nanoarchaeota archaeon]|nr:DEAD/DEAH box helicase [Nanoarchaeota archaeon]